MTLRALAAGAALTLLSGPVWADCAQQTQSLNDAVVAEETGAGMESTMPATKHQEQVLSGNQGGGQSGQQAAPSGSTPPVETAAGGSGDVEALSPHQREVIRGLDKDTKEHAAQLLGEAQDLAQAGKEDACMEKLQEARELLPAQ